MSRLQRWLARFRRAPAPAVETAAAVPTAPDPFPAPAPAQAMNGSAQPDVMRPRDVLDRSRVMLSRFASWVGQLDKNRAIHLLFEQPGAHVAWALKLGRFPLDQQLLRRDANTMAGVLTWLVTLGALVQIAAAL